jgi:DegV family protein with EDD domain
LGISGEEGLLLAKIRLYADNCCDLEQDYLQELGIDSIALKVNINGKSYRDRVDLSPSQFYELIKEAGVMPTTSQVNPAEFEEEFRKILEEGDNEIIYVAFSSGLSGTYQSACIARDMVDPQRITVIDSRSASLGYGLTLIRAARAIAQGLSKEEVIQEIMDNIQRMEHVFIVGDFEMLKRGGRVSAASAFIGSLLSIKVIAEIKEGKINPVEKVKGLKKAKKRLLEIMAERGDNLSEQLIGIAHSNDYEGALKIKDMIAEQFAAEFDMMADCMTAFKEIVEMNAAWAAGDKQMKQLFATRTMHAGARVYCGKLMLSQALLAAKKLAELGEDHFDANFYKGKINTARFYIMNHVPEVLGYHKAMKAGDRSAINMDEEQFM